MAKKRLLRNKDAGIFSGLCQGLGERFELNPWIFRALFIVPALPFVLNFATTIASIVIYVVLSIVIKDRKKVEGGEPMEVEYEIIDDDVKGEDHEDDH